MSKKGFSRIKRYWYNIIGAEISTTTKFCDSCIQIAPMRFDSGQLLETVKCENKSSVDDVQQVVDHRNERDKRYAFLLNGNFNYLTDIQRQLSLVHSRLSRHSRLFIVVYNPFLSILYTIASWIGLRNGPKPNVYLTEKDLHTFTRLTGYEIVRVRPCGFIPFYIPLLSDFVNKLMPIVPLVNRLSLLWVVILRPIKPEQRKPSLSIIIPARNESGNIADVIERMPDFPETDVEVIFVEGNSTDDTWERIQSVAQQAKNEFNIETMQQSGKGKYDAVRLGFSKATGEIVTILDADLTMPPEMLPRFYEAYCRGTGDFINGSRLVYPMENEAMRPFNRAGNIFFCKMVSWITQLPITDSLCGTKLFPKHDYQRIISWRNHFGDFDPFGDFEMLFASSELTLGVIDIPIQYRARNYGETNISRFRNGLELLYLVVIGFFRILLGKTK